MKRLLALAVGLFGLRALLKRYRVRGAATAPPSPVDDLRAKLAETRATEEAQVEEAAERAGQ